MRYQIVKEEGTVVNTSLCASCTVRSNKLKLQSLEREIFIAGDMQ